MKNITFDNWEAEQMRDPEFRAAVEELGTEYQNERRRMDIDNCIICPGCGWTGLDGLANGACPRCGYENDMPPNRLLTLSEMRESNVEYNNVRLDLFLKAYIRLLGRKETNEPN